MQTKNLGMDFLLQNQASPEITINEALERLDSIMFQNAIDIVTALPSEPNFGDAYIFEKNHAIRPNKIAVWLQNKGWVYIEPKIGWGMYVISAQERMRFTQNGWEVEASVTAGNLHAIAKTGDYNDLENKPALQTVATSGSYNDLSDKPYLNAVASSGSYNDLNDKPYLHSIASSGNYNDLNNKPYLHTVAASGNYNDLTGKPTFQNICWTGNYNDLTNKPTTYGRNYITNGDFQVWQRGESFLNASSTTRLADVWRCALATTDTYNITRVTEDSKNAIYVKSVATSGTPQPLFTVVSLGDLFGKTVTLSFTVKSKDTTTGRYRIRMAISPKTGTAYTYFDAGSVVMGTGNEIGTAFKTYSATFTLDAVGGTSIDKTGMMTIAFQKIDTVTNFDLHINSIKLEIGSVATPMESIPYETQFDQCKKYFERISTTTMKTLGSFRGSTATLGIGTISFAEKVSLPTITASSQTAILLQKAVTSPTSTAITFTNIGKRSAQVNVTCASSVGESIPGEMILQANGYIDVSCEG